MTLTYDQLNLFERVLYHEALDELLDDGGDRRSFKVGDRVVLVALPLESRYSTYQGGELATVLKESVCDIHTDTERVCIQLDNGARFYPYPDAIRHAPLVLTENCEPIPIGYAEIESFCGDGWFYCRDGLHYNPLFYHPAPLIDESDSSSNHVVAVNILPKTLDNSLSDFSESCIEEGDRPQSAHQKTAAESFDGQHQDKPIVPLRKKDKWWVEKAPPAKFGEYWMEYQYKTIKGKTYGPYLVQRWRDENGKKRSRYLGKEIGRAHV